MLLYQKLYAFLFTFAPWTYLSLFFLFFSYPLSLSLFRIFIVSVCKLEVQDVCVYGYIAHGCNNSYCYEFVLSICLMSFVDDGLGQQTSCMDLRSSGPS